MLLRTSAFGGLTNVAGEEVLDLCNMFAVMFWFIRENWHEDVWCVILSEYYLEPIVKALASGLYR